LNWENLFKHAIWAALEAGGAILDIYSGPADIEVIKKNDNTPVTRADYASNEIINTYLLQTPYPTISEENTQIPYEQRKNWEYCWIVDPLDGTKEFIKGNGEFTVNIALCHHGRPVFGVIYVPVTKELYYSDTTNGRAFKSVVDADHKPMGPLFMEIDRIQPAGEPNRLFKVVGSRSHMNAETKAFVAEMKTKYEAVEMVSIGSSLKFCLVAEGKAHMYPRFTPTMEWDTAAGSAIVEAVGLKVTDINSRRSLRYNKEHLQNPYFVVSREIID
jgi:3'(2'), 5'-bisphosphate nucleotidase